MTPPSLELRRASDLVRWLRDMRFLRCAEAADEIERLQQQCESYKGQVEAGAKEIERLRAALKESYYR